MKKSMTDQQTNPSMENTKKSKPQDFAQKEVDNLIDWLKQFPKGSKLTVK